MPTNLYGPGDNYHPENSHVPAALVLRFHEELSLEEIAKVTRAPLSTVKSRLYRGLAAIKPKLGRTQAGLLEAV